MTELSNSAGPVVGQPMVQVVGIALDLDGRRVLVVQVDPAPTDEVELKATPSVPEARDAPHLLPMVALGDGRYEARLPAMEAGSSLTLVQQRDGTNLPLDLSVVGDAARAHMNVVDAARGVVSYGPDPVRPPSFARRFYRRLPRPLARVAGSVYRLRQHRNSTTGTGKDG